MPSATSCSVLFDLPTAHKVYKKKAIGGGKMSQGFFNRN